MLEQTLSDRQKPLAKIECVDEGALEDAVMVSLLQRHECKVDKTTVIFPDGTTSQEILPRTRWTERYKLVLPDGLELVWMVNLIRHPAQSVLGVSTVLYEQEKEHIAKIETFS